MAENIAKIEHQQGSTKMIVYSGGEVEFQSGAVLDMQSGHKAYIKGYTTHGTTGTDRMLSNYGHSHVVPTSSGIKFRLRAPEAGIDKFITIDSTIRTFITATTASGGVGQYYGIITASTERYPVLKWLGGGGAYGVGHTLHLRGASTVRWFVMNRPSTLAVAFTTST